MRVLLHCINAGGFIMHLKYLVQSLAKEFPEDQYVVLCMESSELASLGELSNVSIIPVKQRFHLEWTRFTLAIGGVAKIAKAHQVDVIWSVNIGLYFRSGISQVLSLRNAYEVYPWSVARYHPCGQLRTALIRFFFRVSLRASNAVVVQTPLMGKYVAKIAHAPDLVFVVPKAVETLEEVVFEPLPKAIANQIQSKEAGAFTFVYAAAGDPHKNHWVLVQALNLLRKEGANIRVALTLSESEVLQGLAGPSQSLIQSGHLLPLGAISKPHLRTLYEACDACVMPSLLESLSSAHLEAMQWGKPQVVADLPYAHDVCGNAAIYATAEDASDWARKMCLVANDSDLRNRLIMAGRSQMEAYPKTWRESARLLHDALVQTAQDG